MIALQHPQWNLILHHFYESRKFGISEEERAAEDTRIKQLTFSYLEFEHIELAPKSALPSSMMLLFLC